MDHRVARAELEGRSPFDRLQRLHEAACGCLEGRLDELTPGMRALTVLFAFVGDVENGGFEAAMYNSTGNLTGEAIDAATLIGADEHAAVFREFARLGLDGDLSMDAEMREARLEAMSDDEARHLEALFDERYAALPPIDRHLQAYLHAHPHEFLRD